MSPASGKTRTRGFTVAILHTICHRLPCSLNGECVPQKAANLKTSLASLAPRTPNARIVRSDCLWISKRTWLRGCEFATRISQFPIGFSTGRLFDNPGGPGVAVASGTIEEIVSSPDGGIGRRARLRTVCRKACRFKSCSGHQELPVLRESNSVAVLSPPDKGHFRRHHGHELDVRV
jgi:hypothetical protein